MKKYFVAAALIALISACGGGAGTSGTNDTAKAAPVVSNDPTANPDYQKGLDLIAKSDCLTCHKVSEKLIGPAYQDVANKYAGSDTALAYLTHKIINGGSGVWGTIAMAAHPQLQQADVEQMVKYILLLKTN